MISLAMNKSLRHVVAYGMTLKAEGWHAKNALKAAPCSQVAS